MYVMEGVARPGVDPSRARDEGIRAALAFLEALCARDAARARPRRPPLGRRAGARARRPLAQPPPQRALAVARDRASRLRPALVAGIGTAQRVRAAPRSARPRRGRASSCTRSSKAAPTTKPSTRCSNAAAATRSSSRSSSPTSRTRSARAPRASGKAGCATCRRRCTASSPPASTRSSPPNVRCSRTARSSAAPARPPPRSRSRVAKMRPGSWSGSPSAISSSSTATSSTSSRS